MDWVDFGNVVTLRNEKSMWDKLIVLVSIMDQSSFHEFLSNRTLNMIDCEDYFLN
ncbi:hypothetical protein SAMN05216419_102432 [Nitrosomonas cryotolerans]|uniref:Uncharacterized protein n=1 Tax=Nitrosomonas cryotolerans ATCC 49181 TaxID=1131553 RepID=A0A1N6ITN4_9PROT|nr:hypothetical protein SAMN05216419_102432 [Nitrosomonas cryotolerans]SIO35353.1 hypothetical protein SAMN02743940_2065 [Nitrosomonas cryotolerans ATCC 49181]